MRTYHWISLFKSYIESKVILIAKKEFKTKFCIKLINYLKLVVCILLRVLGQVQGFRLTQHWFEYFLDCIYFRLKMAIRPKHVAVTQ
jgi:hypothetical protein